MAEEYDFDGMVDTVSGWIAQQENDGQDTKSLRDFRKALRKVGTQVAEAETRGYQRAQSEVTTRQVLSRFGIPRRLEREFTDVDLSDEAAVKARIGELQADGLQWGTPAPQPGGTTPQAASAVPQGPQPPAQVQQPAVPAGDQQIAQQVTQAQATQAGGQPPTQPGDLQARIQAAATKPGGITSDEAWALAQDLNADLDALSKSMSGGGILG